MITQSFTDLEKAVTMMTRDSDVKDFPHAVVWHPKEKDAGCEVIFRNVSFHYKVSSQQRPLGTSLAQSSVKRPGTGRHGRRGRHTLGVVNEEAANRSKTEEIVKLGGVENINLRVAAGSTIALVGASGSGKSTLVRLMLRMYDCDEGSVELDGNDVKSLTQESLRQNIGVVAQDTILFNATLRENIIYGKEDASDEEISDVVSMSALESFVSKLPDGLDTIVGERGMKLSGGERQRVGLARCIIKSPQMILLDEATSALDSSTEMEIQKNIASLCRNRTTIMIAHRLSTARKADEIIVLDMGHIVERGSHTELLEKNGRYAIMWKIQTNAAEE